MVPEDIATDPYGDSNRQHKSWSEAIREQCSLIQTGLLRYNDKYGSSIFRPVTILSNGNAEQSLRMWIDDRIRKLSNANTPEEERELIDDLIGYLVNFRAYMHTHEPEIWGAFD